MATDIHDLHNQVQAKNGIGYSSVKNVQDNSIQVSKNGGVIFTRVLHEKATDRVFIHDGPNVAVGNATAWLNSLK